MSEKKYYDQNSNEIKINDSVIVDDPKDDDSCTWEHSFIGSVKAFKDDHVVVVDQEDNCFDVEAFYLSLDLD
jgi:hypothetical protein